MKRIVMLLIAIALLSGCYLGPWHDVTYQVTGAGLSQAGVKIIDGVSIEKNVYSIRTIPWSQTGRIGFGDFALYVDTGASTSGSVTATILVDGVVANTATATASGTPASVQISASVPQ